MNEPDPEDTDTQDQLECHFYLENEYPFAFKVIIGTLLTLILTCMNKPKYPKCGCGCCGILLPVRFFEDKDNRLMIMSVFTLIAKDLQNFLLEDSIYTKGMGPFEKQLSKFALSQTFSVIFIPLLVTCTSTGSVIQTIVGFLYAVFFLIMEFLTLLPWCHQNLKTGGGVVAFMFSILAIISCIVLIIKYINKIRSTCKNGREVTCKLSRTSYHVTYVRSLFNYESLEQPKEPENFISKYIYKKIKGFRYSITIQLSTYVGIILVFMISIAALYELVDYYYDLNEEVVSFFKARKVDPDKSVTELIILAGKILFKVTPQRVEKIRKKMRVLSIEDIATEQLMVLIGSAFASVLIALILTCITVLHMFKCYRKNVLDMQRRCANKYVLDFDKLKMSNSSIIVSSVTFAGYQAAHIIWGFFIQVIILLLFFLIVCEVVIVPLTICFDEFLFAILEYIGPTILVIFLTIYGQILLVRLFFVQDKGKVLALDNRRGFYVSMYSMFFYNALTGLITCLVRFLKSVVFSILILPRLDRSVFPNTFERFDTGFKAYSCLLKMEAVQGNSILVVFIAIINSRLRVLRKMNFPPGSGKTAKYRYLKRRAIRNRWFVAWTLMHNEILIHERRKINKLFLFASKY